MMETANTTMQIPKEVLEKFRQAKLQYQAKIKKEITNAEYLLELLPQ